MKKLIFIIGLLSSANAQITEQKRQQLFKNHLFNQTIERNITIDTLYYFAFKNLKYEHIVDIEIMEFSVEEFEQFYQALTMCMDNQKEYNTPDYMVSPNRKGVNVYTATGWTFITKKSYLKIAELFED